MKIKIYMHYLKMKDFMEYQPIMVKTSFSNIDDIEVFIKLKDIVMQKQTTGMLIRRKKLKDRLKFWKKTLI